MTAGIAEKPSSPPSSPARPSGFVLRSKLLVGVGLPVETPGSASFARMLKLLHADERAYSRELRERRLAEWVAGRASLRLCFERLSLAPPAVLAEPCGRPAAPPDLPLSLSHTDGLACAVVGTEEGVGLGVDVERGDPLEPEVLARAFDEKERELLRADAIQDLDSVTAFSLKESAVKAASALIETPIALGFVTLGVDPEGQARLRARGRIGKDLGTFCSWHGRWQGFVLTVVRCTAIDPIPPSVRSLRVSLEPLAHP